MTTSEAGQAATQTRVPWRDVVIFSVPAYGIA